MHPKANRALARSDLDMRGSVPREHREAHGPWGLEGRRDLDAHREVEEGRGGLARRVGEPAPRAGGRECRGGVGQPMAARQQPPRMTSTSQDSMREDM